jgi:DNA-binding MarR family transcriptional regulator
MDNLPKLFDLIVVLARRRHQAAEQHFTGLGLNHTQAHLLTLLHQEGGRATQEVLSNLIFIDRSNAGRALKCLEDEAYIERCKDDGDKRTNLVQITGKGRQAVNYISKQKKKIIQSISGELTEEEAGVIVEMLGKAFSHENKE